MCGESLDTHRESVQLLRFDEFFFFHLIMMSCHLIAHRVKRWTNKKKRKAISTFCQSHFKSCFKETMISVHNSISSFLFLPIPWWTARWSTKFIAGNLFNQGKQFSKSTASRVINCFSSCMISKLCGFIFFIPKQPQLRTAHT